jgi:hypothetical protein
MTDETRICRSCPENGPQPLSAFTKTRSAQTGAVRYKRDCRVCRAVLAALASRDSAASRARHTFSPKPDTSAPIGSLPPNHPMYAADQQMLRARQACGLDGGKRVQLAPHGFQKSSLADA